MLLGRKKKKKHNINTCKCSAERWKGRRQLVLKGLDEVLILKPYKKHNKYLMAENHGWLFLLNALGSTIQYKYNPCLILCRVHPATAPENTLQK